MDSTTNQVYYANVDTEESSWTIPTSSTTYHSEEEEENEREQSYYFYNDDSNVNGVENDSEEERIAKVVQSSSLNQKGTSATPSSTRISAVIPTSESVI